MRLVCLCVVLGACGHPARSPVVIEQVLGATQRFGGVLSPDGRRLLFRSDEGEVAEAYVADLTTGAAPIKVAEGPERVASAVFARDSRTIVFRKDTGANEIFHLYTRDVGTLGAPVDLTPEPAFEPMWRDAPLLPRARPDLLVYGARKPTDYASMLVVQPLAGGEARVVYHESGPGTVLDVLPDASHALWWREAASGGHELAEVDLATGIARPVSDDKPAMLTTAAYSTDGSKIYVATDNGTETHVVVALDRATLGVTATYTQAEPTTAEIASIVPSPRGDVVAIMIDAGNHSRVRMLDARTLAVVSEVTLPDRALGRLALGKNSETRVRLGTGVFADDGKRFELDISLPTGPDDLYLVETATGEGHRALELPATRSLARLPRMTSRIVDIPSGDDYVIPTNVHLPETPVAKKPIMVWLHGGPDASTSLEWNAWNRVFTAEGYVVVEPNIRGSTGFGRAYARADDRDQRFAAVDDLARVNAWLRAQPWADPDRIVIAGASFGGYYTLMALSHQPTLWAAGIDIAGPSSITTMVNSGSSARRYVAELGDPVADAAMMEKLSPINAVDRIVAPLLVYQGINDEHVPREHADKMVAALRARHRTVEYMLVGDEGHTVSRRANEVELLQRILRFAAAGRQLQAH